MHGNVEISQHANRWRVGIEGEPLLQDAFRTLEEAIETAWGIAARLRVAITVGKDSVLAA